MRNIKLTIEYDGANYAGWQCQRVKTIQATIEKAIKKIIHERVKLIGSGRTDAGVAALAQVANFKTNSDLPAWKIVRALNAVLPDDIAVIKAEEAGLDFHSCFSAKSKVYRYTILNRPYKSALLRDRAYHIRYPLNLRLMQKEARALLGRHNFKSFQASDKKERTSVRTIKRLKLRRDGNLIHIDIEADGFLYNMVRNIAGTLIEIGRGKLPPGSLHRIISAKNRRLAGPTAPPKGLCLLEVKY